MFDEVLLDAVSPLLAISAMMCTASALAKPRLQVLDPLAAGHHGWGPKARPMRKMFSFGWSTGLSMADS